MSQAMKKPTARSSVEAIFSGFIEMQRDRNKSRGCMIVSGALACGEEVEPVRRELVRLRQTAVMLIRERFECTIQEGTFLKERNARHSHGSSHGPEWPGGSGGERGDGKELHQVTALAMRAWPG